MKHHIYLLSFLLLFACSNEKVKYHNYPISTVNIQDVVITDSFWLPKIKIIQDTTIRYSFDKCDKEGRMKNFLIAGGVMEGKTCGKMPFDDTDLYKIIEGASYSLISQPNAALDAYLDSIISIIKAGQEADGYITTWFTIDRMSPPATWANASKHRWEFEITNHELYNSGHLFEAAAAHFLATGKRNLLDIAQKNADLLVNNFGPDTLQIPPGHQIVETGLVKLYELTKNEKYLELAKFFLDIRGDSSTHKLYGAYNQDHLPVVNQNQAVGHAVRAVYMYAGMTDIAAIYKDSAYLDAVNRIWENMVNKKMYLTGGIGSRHEGEAFGEDYELPNLTAYNETCAAIGDVYWNHRLFLLTGNSKYYDIIERSLYNGLIAGISVDGTKFFYPNPLESDGIYEFNQGALTRQPWFDCSCCPTNMIRFLPSIPGLIYAINKDSLYINLFLSNKAKLTINSIPVVVSQQTDYPWDGKIKITINTEKESNFTIKIRVPGWAQNEVLPGNLYKYVNKLPVNIKLTVNGKTENSVVKNGYIEITKNWKDNDEVGIELPMSVRQVICNENVVENRNKTAFEYGPIVYCAEEADNKNEFFKSTFTEPIGLNVEKQSILSNKVNVLKGTFNNDKNLTLIPYYLWSNRGTGKMRVWFSVLNSNTNNN